MGARSSRFLKHTLALAIVISLLGLSSCTQSAAPEISPQPTQRAYGSESPTTDASTESEPKSPGVKNDLDDLPLRRSLETGPVTVKVEYTTHLPLEDWRAETTKPLLVTLTATNTKKKRQKIFLTRVTMNFTAYDESGQLDVPQTLTDSANLQPGYIVTNPNTYNQSFNIPVVDRAAIRIVIDMSYEFLLEVDRDGENRDLAKQVATDTLTVPIAAN